MNLYIVGARGTGKTTLIQKLLEDSQGLPLVASGGISQLEAVTRIARAELYRLAPERLQKLRGKMYQEIRAEDEVDPWRIRLEDTHLAFTSTAEPERQIWQPRLQLPWEGESLLAIILLAPPSEEVLRRRAQDRRRKAHRSQRRNHIEWELALEHKQAIDLAAAYRKPLLILKNNRLETNVHDSRAFIRHHLARRG